MEQKDKKRMRTEFKNKIKSLLDKKEYGNAWEEIQRGLVGSNRYFNGEDMDDGLAALYILLYVMECQKFQEGEYGDCCFPYEDEEQLISVIEKIKFVLHRIEWGVAYPEEALEGITPYMVEAIGDNSFLDKTKVFRRVANEYYKRGLDDWAAYLYERYRTEENRDVCFILCTNDEVYCEECKAYIENLRVPENTKTEIIAIENAASMAEGYNYGMKKSKAKYKIYLHQDTFIINENFIFDIQRLFEKDETIGMIGVAGSKKLPLNGVWWNSEEEDCYCQVYQSNMLGVVKQSYQPVTGKDYEEIEAADGVLLATSVDLLWREDLFDGWHFYDISQSLEMKKRGYKIVIPRMDTKWVMHEIGCVFELDPEYDKYRYRFLEEYMGVSLE